MDGFLKDLLVCLLVLAICIIFGVVIMMFFGCAEIANPTAVECLCMDSYFC